MIDIVSWYKVRTKPKKKGTYLLMIGVRDGFWMNVSIKKAYWNGRVWSLSDSEVPMKWKYINNEDENKYAV